MAGHYIFNFTRSGAAKGRSMREQAAELLNVKLWGIGEKAPNRRRLVPGDRVLIYVGAPESSFIGHAELASEAHEWSPDEGARYPFGMAGGVAFKEAQTWPHPVAMLFSGVARITERDYEAVVAAGIGDQSRREPTATPTPAPIDGAPQASASATNLDLLFKTAEKLKKVGFLSSSLSEYDTRAEFIDR